MELYETLANKTHMKIKYLLLGDADWAWQDCRLEATVPRSYGGVARSHKRVLATTGGLAVWKLYENLTNKTPKMVVIKCLDEWD